MTSRTWPLHEAKNRLSEVLDEAARGTLQIITRRGKRVAVVLAYDRYERLTRPDIPLVALLRQAPRLRGGLPVARAADAGRDVDLR